MLVIISGASKGIGFELVKKFADTNMLVLAVSRNTKAIQAYIKRYEVANVLAVTSDISTQKGINSLVKLCKQLNKPVSILINNAGALVNKPFKKITAKDLTQIYKTNVFAPFLLTQALLPYIGKKGRTHIINIGSIGGVQGSVKFPGLSAYSSSKGALSILTECMAEEFKGTSISVNCLALGAVQTEMLAKAFPGYKAPMKPNEMAEFIRYFALNGHEYFNGKILPVSISTP